MRVELTKTAEGWTLARLIEPEDGTYYWSSILSFCDGDEAQARSLTSANTPELHAAHDAALKNWLASIGYPDVTIE